MRDLHGYRSGSLVAIKPVGKQTDGHFLWQCHCDCGQETVVQSNNLTRPGGTKSCGCSQFAAARDRISRFGIWNKGLTYPINGGQRIYKTKHSWAKAVFRAKGRACERCGWDKGRCDVHHIVHRSQGGKNSIPNGMVLCPNCHRLEHEGHRQ
jgi:hypothetical protein